MTRLFALAALLLALLLPAATPGAAAPRDWNRMVTATPEGGWRIGNPAAPVKLIEYASLTCPHCARFAAEGLPELRRRYIAGGKLSLELRQFVLNPIDLTAGMAIRCAPPAAAVGLAEALFADQRAAFGEGLNEEQASRITALPENRRYAGIAQATPITGFLAARGLPASRSNACLADMKQRDRIVAIRDAAQKQFAVSGTPSFVLDGKLLDGVFDWTALAPHLAGR